MGKIIGDIIINQIEPIKSNVALGPPLWTWIPSDTEQWKKHYDSSGLFNILKVHTVSAEVI